MIGWVTCRGGVPGLHRVRPGNPLRRGQSFPCSKRFEVGQTLMAGNGFVLHQIRAKFNRLPLVASFARDNSNVRFHPEKQVRLEEH